MPVNVKLKGRLGNQLFQTMTCISYAWKNGIDYEIPEHTLNDTVWPPYLNELPHLHYSYPKSGHIISVNEETHAYKSLPFESHWAGHLIQLDGYFQSYRYFNKYKAKLSALFGFPVTKFKNVVSVHIRRGDYLNFPDKHPFFTLKYFCEAVGRIFCDKAYHFKIYSDDIAWCMANITKDLLSTFGPNHTIDYVISGEPLHDLKCFMRGEHFLISNSTYSWMGAYFGETQNSLVVTPHKESWFGENNKHLSVEDLLPEKWIQIKY